MARRRRTLSGPLVLLGLLAIFGSPARAQNFIDRWQSRATRTQAEQPGWVTPLVTVTPRLEQELRVDFLREITPKLTDTWVYDNGKGLELIPARRVELLFNLPPYLQHNTPSAKDGFGDVSFLSKYRVLASNEEAGNYILTAFFGGSIPTGSYANGVANATVSPTLAGGKGFGRFDAQSTLNGVLPVGDGDKLGRTINWNTALQYRTGFAYPELEWNATWYKGGPNDGRVQVFATPGILARFPLHNTQDPRLKLVVGAGMQIATSQYHSFNHGLILTARLPF
jgi:hypothetical protein